MLIELKKNRPGFTLIEVAASLVILGLSLISVLRMYGFGLKTVRANYRKVVAINLLQREVEWVRAFSMNTVIDGSGYSPNLGSNFAEYTFLDEEVCIESRAAEKCVANAEAKGEETEVCDRCILKKINVTVFWPSPFGQEVNATISTLRAEDYDY